ncbi:MAG: hypothetical protein GY943_20755 [Chloroflexi bacterium]|nr:hypothetical protein [Chloroflexota bacterium]
MVNGEPKDHYCTLSLFHYHMGGKRPFTPAPVHPLTPSSAYSRGAGKVRNRPLTAVSIHAILFPT